MKYYRPEGDTLDTKSFFLAVLEHNEDVLVSEELIDEIRGIICFYLPTLKGLDLKNPMEYKIHSMDPYGKLYNMVWSPDFKNSIIENYPDKLI